MANGRVQVPPRVKANEPFEVRVIVQHAMETGYRRAMNGEAVPVNIVERLTCRLGDVEVFSAEPGTGISANPYFSFWAVATASAELVVEWRDDRGDAGRLTAAVVVA